MNDESPMQKVGSQCRDIVSPIAALSKPRRFGPGRAQAVRIWYRLLERDRSTLSLS